MTIPLESLNLKSKWPRLSELQGEVSSLNGQADEAERKVSTLQTEVEAARRQDIEEQAAALRQGKPPPKTSREDEARHKLETAQRESAVLRKALEAAQNDLGTLRQKHQHALFQDVVEARARIAADMAAHASKALQGFSRYSDMHYLLKDLRPADPLPDETRAAERSTLIPAVQVVSTSGPDRGHVEGMLQHLISLAPKEKDEEDAA